MDWKRIVKRLFNRLGFEIHQVGRRGSYNLCSPYNYCTYSPWFDDWFQEIYARSRDHTLVTEDRCYVLYQLGRQAALLEGDFAECGVFQGGTARLLAEVVADHATGGGAGDDERTGTRRLHLFDTFEGMPEGALADPSRHGRGDFGDVDDATLTALLAPYPFTRFHEGLLPGTLEAVGDRRFAFVHVDVDLYEPSLGCCEFFYPRMPPGAVMVFDDYGFPRYEDAERRAVEEFFADKPEVPLVLRTGQCLVFKC